MASLTRWTWVWINSGSWRWTGRPGMLQTMGLQRVEYDWVTELNWIGWRMFTHCSETLSETFVYLFQFWNICFSSKWSLEVRMVRRMPSTRYALARQCWIWNYFCWLKKYMQPESRELFYLVRMFRDPETASQELSENCSKEAGGGVSLYICLQQRGQAVWITKIMCQVKEFLFLCIRRCKPLGSLNSFHSYAPQLSGANPVSLFTLLLAFCQLFYNHLRLWQHLLDQFWELAFTFGGQKSLMTVTFLVYWYGQRYFHFTFLLF